MNSANRSASALMTKASQRIGEGRGPLLSFEKISKSYGQLTALSNVTFHINHGEVVCVIGPSGSGKSTVLRCANGLEAIDGGRVLFAGQEVHDRQTDLRKLRQRMGMVFQKPNVFPTMTIYDNVASGYKLNGVRNRQMIAEKVERSLKNAALWEEIKDDLQKPGTSLSGGQQQRLCIARALAVDPEVLLMDEPCSALDPIATAKIEELIHELKETVTIVIVTHNMQQAARVSDYTAFFYVGELIEFGETQKLFTAPEKRQTEDYITGRFG